MKLNYLADWILVVEDDDASADVLQDLLACTGYATQRARDGVEAVDTVLAANRPPMLVLLDLGLPRMGGEAVGLLLRRWYGRHIPLVVLSGLAPERAQASACRMGASLVSKPFSLDHLETALASALDRDTAPSIYQ